WSHGSTLNRPDGRPNTPSANSRERREGHYSPGHVAIGGIQGFMGVTPYEATPRREHPHMGSHPLRAGSFQVCWGTMGTESSSPVSPAASQTSTGPIKVRVSESSQSMPMI